MTLNREVQSQFATHEDKLHMLLAGPYNIIDPVFLVVYVMCHSAGAFKDYL